MKTGTKSDRCSMAFFKAGQMWALKDSSILISEVGKTLVFYKHFKGGAKRGHVLLSAKAVLEKFLRDNRAGLVKV